MTVTVDVWRRPFFSFAGTRWMRCCPASASKTRRNQQRHYAAFVDGSNAGMAGNGIGQLVGEQRRIVTAFAWMDLHSDAHGNHRTPEPERDEAPSTVHLEEGTVEGANGCAIRIRCSSRARLRWRSAQACSYR